MPEQINDLLLRQPDRDTRHGSGFIKSRFGILQDPEDLPASYPKKSPGSSNNSNYWRSDSIMGRSSFAMVGAAAAAT